ncbi:TetR/AcrR family transcriptional regulator [Pendulispora albinea]|uniref:TetR/AcrR family transcriptional regulator n=1 Tax=Pendulispora albinea TaxID=2741071 RepID=A0ABZ2LRQ1_9BACT
MAGRPREFDRDKALKQARDAFWRRGYEGTSMADLVEAMGIASARIYAAFGSKEALFREAVLLYEAKEGGFADRALEEDSVRDAIESMLRAAVETYTAPGKPHGCMVVLSATNTSRENDAVSEWLAEHRRARTAAIVARLRKSVKGGELRADADIQALGDCFATLLHGLSIQARDGVPKKRLLAMIPTALQPLEALIVPPSKRA